MQQFDVFTNPSSRSSDRAPYLIVLPFRYFLNRRTTIIAPLVKTGLLTPIPRLNPLFRIAGNHVVLSPLEIVNIPTVELQTFVANLGPEHETIIAALDLLLTGV